MKNIIVCDCDHFIDTGPLLTKINDTNADIIIPVWDIQYDEQKNWGKVLINSRDNSIVDFYEKQIIQCTKQQQIKGIIGCYYIKSSQIITHKTKNHLHFSEFFNLHFNNLKFEIANIHKAYFFGDPKMTQKAIEDRRKNETIFCDVDGVLVKHRSCSDDIPENNTLLDDPSFVINTWRKEGKIVVLTTARPERTRKSFCRLLEHFNIRYDHLVMGLNTGPRYLINDIKPSNPMVRQSISINLERDIGIRKISLEESKVYGLELIETLKGNSFSTTCLIKKDGDLLVRKYINKSIKQHYDKLKRQVDDLKRQYYYDNSLVPAVKNIQDNDYYFYYDMEYLENYQELEKFHKNIKLSILQKVIDKLSENVYCYKRKQHSILFVEEFFNEKIYPKLNKYEKESELMDYIINGKNVIINNQSYVGIREVLSTLDMEKYDTEYVNPIHGDLTLENILYNENFDDFKLIDPDGSRYVDSCYLDLAKIFQSIVSNYAEWKNLKTVITDHSINNLTCVSEFFDNQYSLEDYKNICQKYAEIMNNPSWIDVYKKGIFYMCMYFIRFVPFRKLVSVDHGIFAMIMCVVHLNNILKINNME